MKRYCCQFELYLSTFTIALPNLALFLFLANKPLTGMSNSHWRLVIISSFLSSLIIHAFIMIRSSWNKNTKRRKKELNTCVWVLLFTLIVVSDVGAVSTNYMIPKHIVRSNHLSNEPEWRLHLVRVLISVTNPNRNYVY